MNPATFALRRGALPGLIMLLVISLAACAAGDTDDDGNGTGNGATATVVDGVVEIRADDLLFDADVIEAPAGEPFTIRFTNGEAVPHNISVYTEEGGELIVLGTVIGEGETDEVQVPALDAGEYFFVCDVHREEMTGTLVVEG